MSAQPLVEEIADLPIESRYPEGVWRVPLEMVLQCSSSSYVGVIRKRQAAGENPFTDGAVFSPRGPVLRGGGLAAAGREQLSAAGVRAGSLGRGKTATPFARSSGSARSSCESGPPLPR